MISENFRVSLDKLMEVYLKMRSFRKLGEIRENLRRLREVFMNSKDVWEELGGVRENFREGFGSHEKFEKNWEKYGQTERSF